MTLFDLLNFIAGLAPIFIGVMVGAKAGILGIAIGLVLGTIIGVGTFLLIRVAIAKFLDRYTKDKKPDNIWNILTVLLIYLGLLVIAFFATFVSEFVVNAVLSLIMIS